MFGNINITPSFYTFPRFLVKMVYAIFSAILKITLQFAEEVEGEVLLLWLFGGSFGLVVAEVEHQLAVNPSSLVTSMTGTSNIRTS